jgi:hypothetical protein
MVFEHLQNYFHLKDFANEFNFVFILIRPHFMSNCSCPWGDSPLGYDQTFKWSLFHCHGGNVVSTHT